MSEAERSSAGSSKPEGVEAAFSPDSETATLRRTLIQVFCATLAGLFVILIDSKPTDWFWLFPAVFFVGAGLAASRRGHPHTVAALVLASLLLCAGTGALNAVDGVRSLTTLALGMLLVVGALLLRIQWFLLYAAAILALVAVVGIREIARQSATSQIRRTPTSYRTLLVVESIFGLGTVAAGLLARNQQRSLEHSRKASEQLQQTNRALRDSENQLRTLIELAADAILIADPRTIIADANQQACQLCGFEKSEIVGRPLGDFFPDPERVKEHLAGPRGTAALETAVVRKDGSRRSVELKSALMPNLMIQVICRDVTDRIEAEAKIQQMQKLESVGRLAGGVAHDFNNLLTVINGYADLILVHLGHRDTNRPRIEEILRAGKRGAELTAKLLAFSRKGTTQPGPIALNRAVKENLAFLRPLMGEHIEVRASFSPAAGTIFADHGQLQQILMNLCVNARDAMPGGGTLTITTDAMPSQDSKAPLRFHLTVSDTGHGMEEAVRRRAFEPFFTTKPPGAGTGLGLSTVSGIVEQLAGSITLESEPGKGTTFRIEFPAYGDAPETNPAEEAAPHRDARSATILLVEDDPAVRALVTSLLQEQGHHVLVAAGGHEALALADQHKDRLSLLLTDVVMPGMNGTQIAERIRQRLPVVKVLYISGYAHDLLDWEAPLPPGVDYLAKPFTSEELSERVRALLEEPADEAR